MMKTSSWTRKVPKTKAFSSDPKARTVCSQTSSILSFVFFLFFFLFLFLLVFLVHFSFSSCWLLCGVLCVFLSVVCGAKKKKRTHHFYINLPLPLPLPHTAIMDIAQLVNEATSDLLIRQDYELNLRIVDFLNRNPPMFVLSSQKKKKKRGSSSVSLFTHPILIIISSLFSIWICINSSIPLGCSFLFFKKTKQNKTGSLTFSKCCTYVSRTLILKS